MWKFWLTSIAKMTYFWLVPAYWPVTNLCLVRTGVWKARWQWAECIQHRNGSLIGNPEKQRPQSDIQAGSVTQLPFVPWRNPVNLTVIYNWVKIRSHLLLMCELIYVHVYVCISLLYYTGRQCEGWHKNIYYSVICCINIFIVKEINLCYLFCKFLNTST